MKWQPEDIVMLILVSTLPLMVVMVIVYIVVNGGR